MFQVQKIFWFVWLFNNVENVSGMDGREYRVFLMRFLVKKCIWDVDGNVERCCMFTCGWMGC